MQLLLTLLPLLLSLSPRHNLFRYKSFLFCSRMLLSLEFHLFWGRVWGSGM